jgi:uncharacterized protein (TIGR03437 family)
MNLFFAITLRRLCAAIAFLIVFGFAGLAQTASRQTAPNRYTLILEDPPAARKFKNARAPEAVTYRQQIQAKHRQLRAELASRKIPVIGEVSTVLNAIFVVATPNRVNELKALPGVIGVVPARRYKRSLNEAVQLVNAPAAWNSLGGVQNAGAGVKVAILDSGIDQNHPAFQDSSLQVPTGFPICAVGVPSGTSPPVNATFNCADFTNNKVIVARSYVAMIAAGSSPDPSVDSRPDDYTPRDHVGHGTAVASCVAAVQNTGAVTFNGMAPKAFLGNYKIYGSPEVNDSTTDQAIAQAADDAFTDGMDVLSFSSGGPAFYGPLDTGVICQNTAGVPCDLVAFTFEGLVQQGMVIVAAAGNENQTGLATNTYNSISSPANAPSVIAAGATTNGHQFLQTVSVLGSGVPSDLQNIVAVFGDGPSKTVTAPIKDVTTTGNDGYACTALSAGSMTGSIALIERGPQGNACTFAVKVTNAQNAGAVGVVFYDYDPNAITPPGGLGSTNIPAAMISNADGLSLKTFVGSNPNNQATMNPVATEHLSLDTANEVAYFSSLGPAITGGLKPDVVAPGTDMYMATQKFDPLGEMYDSSGYTVAQGTSFSTPVVAGAAALVKQKQSTLTAEQIRSAIVNTASQKVTIDDSGSPVDIRSTGAGLIDANAAVNTLLTAVPAVISLGFVAQLTLPETIPVQITNVGSAAQSLVLSFTATSGGTGGLSIDHSALSLAPGATGTVNVTFSGTIPAAGVYSGFLVVQGVGATIRLPYMYVVGDGRPNDMIPLTGFAFDGSVGQGIPDGVMSFMVVDQYGVPVANAPVTWTADRGSGITFSFQDSTTDSNGLAFAQPTLGPTAGAQSATGTVTGAPLSQSFSGTARPVPNITDVQDAATYQTQGFAPGSYIALFDNSGKLSLSDTTDENNNPNRLPLAIDYVQVSFDVPSANISAPGHLSYVSGHQINVQVPWEVAGQTSVRIKDTIDYSTSNVFPISIATYAPGFFETAPGVVAAQDTDHNYTTINSSYPAHPGMNIVLYANGLGPVTNQPASGEPALGPPNLSATTTTAVVTIGGRQITPTIFSGLTPTAVGLYQINVTIPADMASGNQTVSVAIGGATSKASNIQIQ